MPLGQPFACHRVFQFLLEQNIDRGLLSSGFLRHATSHAALRKEPKVSQNTDYQPLVNKFGFVQQFIYLVCIVCANDIKLTSFNPLNPELNPICYLLTLLAHHFLHVSRIRVKSLTFRRLTSYIYGAPILDVSRSYTTTQHSR